jgi:osmotically inducible protein OsmC
VPGVDADTFARLVQQAKDTCPVSKALAGTEITLEARLAGD